MKEQITLRLYAHPQARPCCESMRYMPAEDVKGWDYQRGDQIGLQERDGGYLMGEIDRIDPQVRTDQMGQYKLATLWTLD